MRRCPEALELCTRHLIVALVGAREVREQAQLAWRGRKVADTRERRGKLAWCKAEPVHAGVDLQPQCAARRGGVGALEQIDLRGVVDHEVEPLVHRFGELGQAEHPLEQQDARADAGAAQRQRFLQPRDRECIGITERECRAHEPVAVGVGLHDRDHARPGSAGADDAEVVSEGVAIDDGPYERPHRSTPSA